MRSNLAFTRRRLENPLENKGTNAGINVDTVFAGDSYASDALVGNGLDSGIFDFGLSFFFEKAFLPPSKEEVRLGA